jgi:NADPH-dependent 2,4-dienoyl-CoA reductase/sulfur reductase-like enzyme
MSLCTRRSFSQLAGAACLATPCARAHASGSSPRIVIIGGGVGGATVARYLSMSPKPLDILLVEPKKQYTTCFFSNLYLAGLRSVESLTFGYDALADRHGVRVIHDRASTIDPIAKTVRLDGGTTLAYDRLIASPGIAFRPNALAGYDESAEQIMPHAWMAGPQTQLLRRQLEDMPDGGVFTLVAPPEPYRCPPGPYERASMVAAYFKAHKPRSKILILDTKDTYFEQEFFQDAWNRHYPGMIEWLPAEFLGPIERVDAKTRSLHTAAQIFKSDVANVIPAQMAADFAQRADLADSTGWCPVDPATFESTLHPGIHLVGDAISPGDMPKSAFAANLQAKACAFAIEAALTGADRSRPFLYNTCYTFFAPNDAISDAINFKIAKNRIAIADIEFSRLDESDAVRAGTVNEADAWYEAFTRDIFGVRVAG